MDYSYTTRSFWIRDLSILSILIGCTFFLFLGTRPLGVPDEGNYAEIIREMFTSGNFITPYLNEIKFFEKPILLYWLGALALKIGGINLWALRSVNAILALALCLMTYMVARQVYSRRVGWYASLILASNVLFFGLAHFITTDMTVSVFLSMTLLSVLLFIKDVYLKPWPLYIASVSAGLAVLAKGLIGIFLPSVIIFSWLVFSKEWRLLKRIPWTICIFLFCITALPWHTMVMIHNPEFFQIYFVEHHFLRYATRLVGHPQPLWYYLPVLLVGFYPWVMFLPQTVVFVFQNLSRKISSYQSDLLLLIWAIVIIAFFTIATSKLVSYILPAFPPLAILTARYVAQSNPSRLKFTFAFLIILNIIFSILLSYFSNKYLLFSAQKYLIVLYTSLIIGSLLSYYWLKKKQLHFAILNLTIFMFISLIIAIVSIPSLDARSIFPLTSALQKYRNRGEPVVAFNHFYQDLSFYLQEKIYILNSHKLLKKGMLYQPHHEWLLTNGTFETLWQSPQNVFAIMHAEEFQHLKKNYPNLTYHVVAKTPFDILIKNSRRI